MLSKQIHLCGLDNEGDMIRTIFISLAVLSLVLSAAKMYGVQIIVATLLVIASVFGGKLASTDPEGDIVQLHVVSDSALSRNNRDSFITRI